MAWVEAKRIKGKTYLYLRWRDRSGERTRTPSRYLGRAGSRWYPGATVAVDWQPGQPLPAVGEIPEPEPPQPQPAEPPAEPPQQPPAPPVTAEPPEPGRNNGRRWPACVCCGRPAQRLYRGEPACYKCARYMQAHDDDCP